MHYMKCNVKNAFNLLRLRLWLKIGKCSEKKINIPFGFKNTLKRRQTFIKICYLDYKFLSRRLKIPICRVKSN